MERKAKKEKSSSSKEPKERSEKKENTATKNQDADSTGPVRRKNKDTKERLDALEAELAARRKELWAPADAGNAPDSDTEDNEKDHGARFKSQFDVTVYEEGEESEGPAHGGFMSSSEEERERETLKKELLADTPDGARRRKQAKEFDDWRRKYLEEEQRKREKKKIPKGWEEVSEEEYWKRVKLAERASAFLGFGTVGFFCFIYVILMGVIFSLLYLGTYMRDPRFFDPFKHNGIALLMGTRHN